MQAKTLSLIYWGMLSLLLAFSVSAQAQLDRLLLTESQRDQIEQQRQAYKQGLLEVAPQIIIDEDLDEEVPMQDGWPQYIRLTAIMRQADGRRLAMINNRFYQPGEEKHDVKVLQIFQNSVSVSFNGQVHTIEIGKIYPTANWPQPQASGRVDIELR